MKTFLLILLLTQLAMAEEMSFTKLRHQRNVFFDGVQMEGLNGFDDSELDLLYKDLPNLTILELYRKYPELTPKELESLKTKRK